MAYYLIIAFIVFEEEFPRYTVRLYSVALDRRIQLSKNQLVGLKMISDAYFEPLFWYRYGQTIHVR